MLNSVNLHNETIRWDKRYIMAEQHTKNNNEKDKTRSLVLTGLFFGIAIVLSIIEGLLPPLPIPVPGVKFGLSNIAVMYALFFLTKKQAYAIAVLKSVFAAITRGITAGLLSFSGGVISLTVMIILIIFFKQRISYIVLSIAGAVSHNIGQFIAISLIYAGMPIIAYLPVLLVSGVIAGIVTAALLKFIIPAFNRLVL